MATDFPCLKSSICFLRYLTTNNLVFIKFQAILCFDNDSMFNEGFIFANEINFTETADAVNAIHMDYCFLFVTSNYRMNLEN